MGREKARENSRGKGLGTNERTNKINPRFGWDGMNDDDDYG
jgi:hypothetical protein